MFQSKSKISRCLVCTSKNLEYLCHMCSIFLSRLRHGVAICRDCGHVQVDPIFTEQEYEEINHKFFTQKYLVGNQENSFNNEKKIKKLEKRLTGHMDSIKDVLDVGPGEGWSLDYFHKFDCRYYAVEKVNQFAKHILEKGGMVISSSLSEGGNEYEGFFDLIVCRHVLEHVFEPEQFLKNIYKMLKQEGYLYLALPNAFQVSENKKGYRTSYLRPVHISYFCPENVYRLCQKVGFEKIFEEVDDEIFFLLKKTQAQVNVSHDNYYQRQKIYFSKQIKKNYYRDFFNIIKIYIRRYLFRRALLRR